MIRTRYARQGAVVAPHHLAAQAGLAVLREGGNAIEAMVAAASTIAVVYPHMNSIGGDGFWLIARPGRLPIAIDAAGPAAQAAHIEMYRSFGGETIPTRGPLAALTVPGAVGGWQEALTLSRSWGGRMPPSVLLREATHHAAEGYPVTESQVRSTSANLWELRDAPGFANVFLDGGRTPSIGALQRNPALARTLEQLAYEGLDSFYRGDLGRSIAEELAEIGSPLSRVDLTTYVGIRRQPLQVETRAGSLFNLGAPTQGLVSLLIVALYDALGGAEAEPQRIHLLIEATKAAFKIRDAHITDPARLKVNLQDFLQADRIRELAASIGRDRASPWARASERGDTVWMGAIDRTGLAVSYIQSVYWEFGSGVVLPRSGILLQNRGAAFSLNPGDLNSLQPGAKPFHTLNPALARLNDGRVMVYGAMGGEGQPQTQAAVITRYAFHGIDLQSAITQPRWLLGRTWGAPQSSLRIERGADACVMETLQRLGHPVLLVDAYDEVMGHAGAIVRRPDGVLEAASDPRSDGVAACF